MARGMNDTLAGLTDADLRILAAALRSGRIAAPFTAVSLQRLVSGEIADDVTREFQSLVAQGFAAAQIATILDLIVRDRLNRSLPDGVVDLVTTGPDAVGANRDTGVVVRELFANAAKSVLVAGYAVYQGHRVFQALADRMQQNPALHVSMFLEIQRPSADTSAAAELVHRFADRFKRHQWPNDSPIPNLYYDPRSLDLAQDKRACLHAKCVVVDGEKVFVSSANFTEAAQLRNIEVGVLIESPATANQITAFFTGLVGQRVLLPIG
jgi:phosphatidylserine/phosphatidylglycerophosphate/cardiolipin synthase-like enzyme